MTGRSRSKAVNDIQAGYKLTPLSDWGTAYTPPTNVPTNTNVDTSSTPQSQVQKMSPQAFFSQLAKLMDANPPSAADEPVVKQMARIGVVPGKAFDWNKLSSDIQREISRGVKKGEHDVTKLGLKIPGSTKENGWLVNLEKGWGNYGTDYSLRSAAAFSALGAVLPQDDTYFVAGGDAKRNSYTIKFPEGPGAAGERGVGHRHVRLEAPSGEQPDQPLCDRATPGAGEQKLGRVVHRLRAEQEAQFPQAATELAPGPRRSVPPCDARLLAEGAGTERHLVSASPEEGKLKPVLGDSAARHPKQSCSLQPLWVRSRHFGLVTSPCCTRFVGARRGTGYG